MRYTIKQLPINNEMTLLSYDFMEERRIQLTRADYVNVWTDEVDDSINDIDLLNKLYEKFNTEDIPNFAGRSMSVSDVVEIRRGQDKVAYYCDSFGWKKLDNEIFYK